MSEKKTVLLGVTGCIAAYKAAEIVRGLQKTDIRVKVVMTEHACEFVGPTTFRALTNEPVAIGLFDDPSDPIHHISLAQEADLFLIAPCTGNVLAKIANGIADDLLTTTALATQAPLVVAPAMNVNMYENEITQQNMRLLLDKGAVFVDADDGYLACGDVGKGRLADVEKIIQTALECLEEKQSLSGKRIMITAGPTREYIDPVRYISNPSTGKMGYALAQAASRRGAEVVLISGPTHIAQPLGSIEFVPVVTAVEMFEAAKQAFDSCDAAFFTAAVGDMRPAEPSERKLKKGHDDSRLNHLELTENPDILATLGAQKKDRLVVGFAAETHDVLENAKTKLVNKQADYIVANDVSENKGFATDSNKAWIVSQDTIIDVPELSKRQLANKILDIVFDE